MIKIALIDDEAHVRLDLREKIEAFFGKEEAVILEADGVDSGLALLKDSQPNLVFLDIDIIGGTGFDILAQIPNKQFDLIFVTGYNNQAIRAIKAGAMDYILKPVDEVELRQSLRKVMLEKQEVTDIETNISVTNAHYTGDGKKRIILRTSEAVYAIFEEDICYCKSDGNYTTFYTQQRNSLLISKPIKHFEEILSESVFVRCHKSYLVNKNYVVKYNKRGVLILSTGAEVPVSTRRKEYTIKKIF